MALPTIKIACSNGHFQESLQNYGDRGTWTSATYDGSTETDLVDSGANWVVDEWIGYYVVFDTGGTPTPVIITDNDQNSITVAGDYSAQASKDYRIAGGVMGTCTANPSATSTIIVTGITNKWGETVTVKVNEFVNMKIVPDKLDGTEYTITANTGATGASVITISDSSSKAITATTCEIGRGASATLYPEEVNISGELNEPKQLSTSVVYNVDSGFEDDDSITNPLQLGSLVRVSETTGNTTLFEGNIYESPVEKDPESRSVSLTAYDRMALLDHTVIPVTTDDPATYSFNKSTPTVHSGASGSDSNNNYMQTKGYQDYTYAPRPLAISAYSTADTSDFDEYYTSNTDGTWASVQATSGSSGATLVYSTGGFLTGTPGTDCVDDGSVVIKLDDDVANIKVTYVSSVTNDTTLVTTDDVSWSSGDYFIILSKNWQLGVGVESDADYGGSGGFAIETVLREALGAVANDADSDSGDVNMYVGKSSGTQDVHLPYLGRGWLMIMSQAKVEFAHYSGYLPDYVKDKFYLKAYNETPDTPRNSRGDLTGRYREDTSDSSYVFTGSTSWSSGVPVVEVYPNRFGVNQPQVWIGTDLQEKSVGTTVSEGVVQFSQGDTGKDALRNVKAEQYSYDGDARSSNPDKGTASDAVDITDIVKIATTGIVGSSDTAGANRKKIISSSKLSGGAGLRFSDDSLNTGIYVNKFDYKAYGDTKSSIHPKELINKLCDDASLLYDIRYDDTNEKIIFKPLAQKASADLTLATGSVVSLTREKDVSDVFSAMLVQVSAPLQSYFDPSNIIQYGCDFNASGVPASSAIPSAFSSGGYSSGTPPKFFWSRTYLQGLGPDVTPYTKEWTNRDRMICQSVWMKNEWVKSTHGNTNVKYRRKWGKADGGKNMGYSPVTQGTDGTYLPIITMWFRGGVTMKKLDEFKFNPYWAHELKLSQRFRVEVSTDMDVTDPLNTSTTWQPYNDYAQDIHTDWGRGSFSREINLSKGGVCSVQNVKGLRILGIAAADGMPGWMNEGRQVWRRLSNAEDGYQTWGSTTTADSTPNTSLAEDFTYATTPSGYNRSKPFFNSNKQDASGISDVDTWKWNSYRGNSNHTDWNRIESGFETAIAATDGSPETGESSNKAGYVQASYALGNFDIRGEGVYAMYVRVTKNNTTNGDPTRKSYSPSYKKIANMGYKINPIPLENFSDAEALTIGNRFLDDKLRRYTARDYALEGKSPFINSNNIPTLGQTITISDDSYTGILTSYEFTMNADGSRFDFRLEDYDRNNNAKYIQAK